MGLHRKNINVVSTPIPVQDESSIIYFPVEELPSQGLCYPLGVSFSYRRYGWLEMKVLSQRRDNLSMRDKIKLVFRGLKCSDSSFDLNDLTFADFIYLSLLRKVATINPPSFSVKYKCPKCGRVSSFTVLVSDIQFDNIKAPSSKASVSMEGLKAVFKPLTIGRYLEFFEAELEFPEWEKEALWAYSCISHEPKDVMNYFIERATPDDIYLMRNLDKLFYHGIISVKNACKNYIEEIIDKDEYERIHDMEDGDLFKLLSSKGYKFIQNREDSCIDKYLIGEGIINKIQCGFETDVSLDGGEGLILPFRRNGKSFEDSVKFSN